MDLEQQVEAAFAPGGILSRTTDHFMPRTGQRQNFFLSGAGFAQR
jgi:hypothetical protein